MLNFGGVVFLLSYMIYISHCNIGHVKPKKSSYEPLHPKETWWEPGGENSGHQFFHIHQLLQD